MNNVNSCIAVHTNNLTFYYDSRKKVKILDDLNVSVKRGIIYGLLGPSGCGKTTLLRCLVGLLKPNAGTIKIFDHSPCEKGFCIPGHGVGFMPQEMALYPEITVEEVLTYFGILLHMTKYEIQERIYFLTTFLELNFKNKLIKNLSGGQQKRVSFAAALIHQPPLLLLDEPTVGIDPVLRLKIWEHLQYLITNKNTTIIITTHYIEEARQAQMVGLMREGKLLAEMPPEALIQKYNTSTLEEAFLNLCMNVTPSTSTENTFTISETCDLSQAKEIQEENIQSSNTNGFELNTITLSKTDESKFYEVDLEKKEHKLFNKTSEFKQNSSVQSSFNRLLALILKNVIRLRRNIPLLGFQVLVPALHMTVFFFCMGGEPFDLPVAVVNLENKTTGMGQNFLAHINNKTIKLNPYSNITLAIESAKRRENWGVIYIGSSFSESLIKRQMLCTYTTNETILNSIIRIYLDMTNKLISMTLISTISRAFQEFTESMSIQKLGNSVQAMQPLLIDEPIYGEKDSRYYEFLAPGVIQGVIYFLAMNLTTMSIINEKKEGLLERSWIAGVKTWETVASIMIVLFLVMVVQIMVELLVVFYLFDFPIRGSILLFVLASLISGLSGMAFGIFVSSISSTMDMALTIALGSFMFNFFLNGILWPLEAMPYPLRYLAYCLPLTLMSASVQSILSRGWDLTDGHIWDGYLITSGWMIIFILLSCFIFSKTR